MRQQFVRYAFAFAFVCAPATLPLAANAAAISTDALALQVALDRAGFSPGVIDGTMGGHTRDALRGFQRANRIKVTGRLDAKTREALGHQDEPTVTVMITDADTAGPFLPDIPESLPEQAMLDGLHYESVEEALAEKYHTTPETLRALNEGADFSAGSQIVVPAVRAEEFAAETANDWEVTLDRLSVAQDQPVAARVVVDKSERHVRVFDAKGKLIAQFPATIGSTHDPLPLGRWRIRGVARMPPFDYNPKLFWDAGKGDVKAKVPPGPNGPVGVAWIDLSKPHYGIHGTPNPETVGRTFSHGCIRLTNWDAAKLAQMVRTGTPAVLQR